MKLSCILTLHDRPLSVLKQVFDSLKSQAHDELVIVLDRTPVVTGDYCVEYWWQDPRVVFVELDGPPGWKSPVKAWNAGFQKATGNVFYCFSSETVQAEGNVERAKHILDYDSVQKFEAGGSEGYVFGGHHLVLHGSVSCSCGPTGTEVNWNGTAPGNLFCDAAHPRPLGFIWAAPAWAVKQIGGYDEAFADGFWFDDNDFFLRLWRTGLDFVFDDSLSGLHLHHERPALNTPEGQQGIARNQAYMLQKHGILHTLRQVPRIEEKQEGRTTWRHL